jgi:hypothetical protein
MSTLVADMSSDYNLLTLPFSIVRRKKTIMRGSLDGKRSTTVLKG